MFSEGILASLGHRMALIEKAAAYEGRTREKILALGEAERVYYCLYPRYYRAIQTICMVEQLGVANTLGVNLFQVAENRLASLLLKNVVDALCDGDLQLRHDQRPSEIAFAVCNFAFGARAMMNCQIATRASGLENIPPKIQDTTALFLDSLGWQPLSTDWNYAHTRLRIRRNLFAREWEQIRALTGQTTA
ncbi:MAG: hypothetical protein GXY44_06485 [Phycisphaerales bacterium]|nr:hypothetical protein [Phycisphaerales bacterium]